MTTIGTLVFGSEKYLLIHPDTLLQSIIEWSDFPEELDLESTYSGFIQSLIEVAGDDR